MTAELYPIERHKGVHRFLVTARNEEDVQSFHLKVCLVANAIERRDLTTLYTVFDEEVEGFLNAAHGVGITVQQRVGSAPYWNVVILGVPRPWQP